jgi:hypothetical protein
MEISYDHSLTFCKILYILETDFKCGITQHLEQRRMDKVDVARMNLF